MSKACHRAAKRKSADPPTERRSPPRSISRVRPPSFRRLLSNNGCDDLWTNRMEIACNKSSTLAHIIPFSAFVLPPHSSFREAHSFSWVSAKKLVRNELLDDPIYLQFFPSYLGAHGYPFSVHFTVFFFFFSTEDSCLPGWFSKKPAPRLIPKGFKKPVAALITACPSSLNFTHFIPHLFPLKSALSHKFSSYLAAVLRGCDQAHYNNSSFYDFITIKCLAESHSTTFCNSSRSVWLLFSIRARYLHHHKSLRDTFRGLSCQ